MDCKGILFCDRIHRYIKKAAGLQPENIAANGFDVTIKCLCQIFQIEWWSDAGICVGIEMDQNEQPNRAAF